MKKKQYKDLLEYDWRESMIRSRVQEIFLSIL